MRRDVPALERGDARIPRQKAVLHDAIVGVAFLRSKHSAIATDPDFRLASHGYEPHDVHVGVHAMTDE
jgi:hypothetical protein